jgi:hypothetical protein
MTMKMLAGAAAIVALVATPAMAAQQNAAAPQNRSADAGGVKMKKMKTQAKSQARLDSRAAVEPRGTGFAPLDFAGNVAGGAVNTAGAIAGGAVSTAGAIAAAPFTPFRGDSYAYYRDTNTGRGVIADDNGPKCLPGQLTTINGRRMRCQ